MQSKEREREGGMEVRHELKVPLSVTWSPKIDLRLFNCLVALNEFRFLCKHQLLMWYNTKSGTYRHCQNQQELQCHSRQVVSQNVGVECCETRQCLTHPHGQKAQAPAELTLRIMMTKCPDTCSPQKGLIHLPLSVTVWIAVCSQVTKLDLS